ncbi:EamA family transporter [Corynebacterium uterequi]|uniref:Putative permease, DMT superfamily n=1 Tax=Corynebacterium uterequi TaxID=1072256 RepID=A0A0G3HHN2_9CORY|nr:EamA family transporter [Corynebacterium uterequi]AKK11448.1 putative permease, DMT superfamily [Corynebacterium uterequi]
MVASGVSLYLGAALAVGLFGILPPSLVAWFRVSGAAVMLLLLARPKPAAFVGRPGLRAALYGLATLTMNVAFYEAIARIPMGTVVAIEFLGPVLVAAWGSRSARDWIALVLAGVGVLTLSGAAISDSAVGVACALAAGGAWAAYILLGSRMANGSPIGVGFFWAGLLTAPLAWSLWPSALSPTVSMAGMIAGLALLSAAIPYSLDQKVLRIAGPSVFALLQAILPVVAAVVGAVALGQWLSVAEVIGIGLVVCAVALRR